MAKRTVVGVSEVGRGQKARTARKPIKKNDLALQVEVDAVKSDLPLDVSDVEATSAGAGLGDGGVFSKMISNAVASDEGAPAPAAGGAGVPQASAGGLGTEIYVATGLGLLGGIGFLATYGEKAKPPVFGSTEVAATGEEDKPLSGSVKATDPNGDTLTYAVGSAPANGSVTVNADGSYVYTPKANYAGSDSFTITASDGKGGTATQAVKVTVTPVNDAPVITSAAQAGAVVEDGALSATGKFTSSDVDAGATATYTGSKVGTYGSFTIDAATGAWKYDLDNATAQALAAGEAKTETFAVVVTDDKGATATQNVVVTVTGSNDAPVISTTTTATGAVVEDGALSATGTVASSDVDVTGKTATYTGSKAGTYGSFTIDAATGAWKYDLDNASHQNLDEGEVKTEVFTVTVTDDKGATATQNVTVTVTGTNDLPVVSATSDRAVSFQEAGPTALVASSQMIKVAGTDADGGEVTFLVPPSTAVADITLASDGSGFTYTPKDINYHGTETIVVRLNDAQGAGKFTEYSVQVTVTPNTAENQRIDNGLTKAAYNAAGSGLTAGDNFTFIDDSSQTTNVEITNFQLGDKIQVSASASKYSFAVTGAGDLEITYIDTASGASNVILLKGVAVNAGFIEDEVTAETQLGLGNFFMSLADGATNASGATVAGTSLDVDSDTSVNTFALFSAAGGDIAFAEDANLANRALIQGFGAGDTITVSNAAAAAYSFARDTNAGNDIVITYNNDGKINEIVLQGAATGSTGTLDTLASVEALLGAGFFKAVGGSGGSGGGGGTQPFVPTDTVVADNASGRATVNAGTGSIKFTDDAGVRSDVILQNFSSDDRIFTNTAADNYNFAISEEDPDDLVITFNNNGVLNQFVLDEVLAGKDAFIDNYASAVTAVGFEFMNFG
jgi:VCBS repeat-containing protein